MTAQDQIVELLVQRLRAHIAAIYPDAGARELISKLLEAFWPDDTSPRAPRAADQSTLSPGDAVVITYGNTIVDGRNPPLVLLKDFLERHLGDALGAVHILPFFPYTSDDGFAVVDYYRVNSALGDWHHVGHIADRYRLMADLVLNHVSSSHEWMVQFRQGKSPGACYIRTASLEDDLSKVVRPRSHPLLASIETASGEQHVWCTFSHDQVDVDFSNPDLLVEYVRILRFLIGQGVRIVRLDAVAFIWKEPGTSCIHLPQAHEIVRLIRTLCDHCEHDITLITETNVPNQENLTYFGNRNEAHAIYNFSLPPLLLYALLSQSSEALNRWLMTMPPAQLGCAYLNFTASHDGIGLRPLEGLLSEEEKLQMIEAVTGFGGLLSMRKMGNGEDHPYEINIALFDAMKGTLDGPDQFQLERFICSQLVMMSLQGIPAFYIHSLLATPNDTQGVERTRHNRSINRAQLDYGELESELADPASKRHRVFIRLKEVITLRARQHAFHPNALQSVLQLGDSLFGVERIALDQSQTVLAIANFTDRTAILNTVSLDLPPGSRWHDLLGGIVLDDRPVDIELQPYQCLWLASP
ncbi:MAG: sugar phosphorylase [Anderseniella sp.]|nr:sugar phosphorylase [Anderseniella sp.]